MAAGPNGQAFLAGSISLGMEETLAAKVTGDNAMIVPPSRLTPHTSALTPNLAFTTQPSNGTAGKALAPAVIVKVQLAGVVINSTASITLTSSPAAFSATVSAVNGVATFPTVAF